MVWPIELKISVSAVSTRCCADVHSRTMVCVHIWSVYSCTSFPEDGSKRACKEKWFSHTHGSVIWDTRQVCNYKNSWCIFYLERSVASNTSPSSPLLLFGALATCQPYQQKLFAFQLARFCSASHRDRTFPETHWRLHQLKAVVVINRQLNGDTA